MDSVGICSMSYHASIKTKTKVDDAGNFSCFEKTRVDITCRRGEGLKEEERKAGDSSNIEEQTKTGKQYNNNLNFKKHEAPEAQRVPID